MTEDPNLDSEHWRYHNVERLEDALRCLYETVIVDNGNAELRGMAITAIDRMIINMRGESTVAKIEAVPYSERLRASEDPKLRNLEKELRNFFKGDEE